MGLFGPSREVRQKREDIAKAFSKFQGLIRQLRPGWSLSRELRQKRETPRDCTGELGRDGGEKVWPANGGEAFEKYRNAKQNFFRLPAK